MAFQIVAAFFVRSADQIQEEAELIEQRTSLIEHSNLGQQNGGVNNRGSFTIHH